MAVVEAKAGTKINDEEVEAAVNWEVPDTVQGCVDAFGEEVVHEHFVSHATRNLQNRIRQDLRNGLSEEQIQAKYSDGGYVPGEKRTTDPTTKVYSGFAQIEDPEQKREALRKIMAQAGFTEDQIEAAMAQAA